MRKFTGEIGTNKIGSDCAFDFEVPDNATQEEIEEAAREAAFDLIDWHFEEVACDQAS